MGDDVDGVRVVRSFRAKHSGLTVAAGMDHEFGPGMTHVNTRVDDERAFFRRAEQLVHRTIGGTSAHAQHDHNHQQHRDGADATAGTAYDQPFTTIEEMYEPYANTEKEFLENGRRALDLGTAHLSPTVGFVDVGR